MGPGEQLKGLVSWWGVGEIYHLEKLYNVYIFTWWFKLRSFVEIPFSCFWLVIFSLNVYRHSNPEELSCDQGMHCHGGLHVGKHVWNSDGRVLWTSFLSVSKVYKNTILKTSVFWLRPFSTQNLFHTVLRILRTSCFDEQYISKFALCPLREKSIKVYFCCCLQIHGNTDGVFTNACTTKFPEPFSLPDENTREEGGRYCSLV